MGQGRVIGSMGRCRLTLALIALSLEACHSQPEPLGTGHSEDGEYTLDATTHDVTATIKTSDGPVTLRSGADVEATLPQGVSLYPGADVVRTTTTQSGAVQDALATMRSPDEPAAIIDFYRGQAFAAGWTTDMDLATPTTHALTASGPDGLRFSVSVQSQTGGALMTLRVSSRVPGRASQPVSQRASSGR